MEGPAGLQRWAGAAALPPPLSPEDGTRDPGAGPSVGAGTMGGGWWEPRSAPRVHVTGVVTREGGRRWPRPLTLPPAHTPRTRR